ncbi:sulfite exporter TauE/SafE family protein [Micromonospora orduensis]|uniref:Sulfite exporter TauE/SafE family protein n=1 Tax=Micromonospora orduensis TaxID=1420891 RepID=A0A5C4QYG3_9ACTN|nr:sulfite exporter TauE/SafE family protein [Micromonospora orduensis]
MGTSLLVIAVNWVASLVARTGSSHYDWALITPFTLAAIIASLAGKRAADRLSPTATTRGFAALILVMAATSSPAVRTATVTESSAPSQSPTASRGREAIQGAVRTGRARTATMAAQPSSTRLVISRPRRAGPAVRAARPPPGESWRRRTGPVRHAGRRPRRAPRP